MKNKNFIKAFIVASSLPCVLITMMYTGAAFKKAKRPSDVPFELFPIFIPLVFGLFGIMNYYIIKKYGINYSLLVGVGVALALSFTGRFLLNLPIKIFNFTKENDWMVHFIAMPLYAGIFRLIVTPLTLYSIQ